MSKFADLSKAVKDLLIKPFNYERKIEFKNKAADGVTFVADAKLSDKSAVATLTVSGKAHGFSIDKLSVGTDKKIVGEYVITEAARNTDITMKFSDGSRTAGVDTTVTVGTVFRSADFGTYTIDADVITGPVFSLSGLYKYCNFLVGGSTKIGASFLGEDKKVKAGEFADCSVALGYKVDDFTVYVQSNKHCESVDFALIHAASPSLTAGFTSTLFRKDATKPFAVTFGGSYKVDDNTTVHATADQAATVSFAYKQKLSSNATVTVSSQIDAVKLAEPKFGLTLSLSN